MNVTDVCKILAACPSAEEIHLVLLRYVGPIRSSNAIEQQGYEVIDPDVARTQDLQLKKTNSFLNRTNSFGRKNSNVKEPIKLSKSLSHSGRQQLTEQKRQKAVSNDKENISNQGLPNVVGDELEKIFDTEEEEENALDLISKAMYSKNYIKTVVDFCLDS